MEELETKKYLTAYFVRFIPLLTLCLVWIDVGDKPFYGVVYTRINDYSCIIGYMIMLFVPILKLKWKYKVGLNLLGNLIYWVPVFYDVYKDSLSLRKATIYYYISFIVVIICCFLQLKMIYINRKD